MVTASRMPVPDPMAPRKSAKTERAPMHNPPNAAAVGMYLEQRKGFVMTCFPTRVLAKHLLLKQPTQIFREEFSIAIATLPLHLMIF